MNESREEPLSSSPSRAGELTGTRIDPPHSSSDAGAVDASLPSRRRKRKAVAERVDVASDARERPDPVVDAPQYVVKSAEPIDDIVVRHADDLSLHLAARLQEIEQRELAVAERETKFREANAAAQSWVAERDIELTARERDVQFREEEAATRAAAIAAAELAGEEELATRRQTLNERERELQQQAEELDQRAERLRAERAALDQASDRLRAERRREEEMQRSRRQQWQTQMEADRAQAERMVVQLQRHRLALDHRERALHQREQESTDRRGFAAASASAAASLEALRVQAEATRDHRMAAEHRWIAGQLWQRLVDSDLVSHDQLSDALARLRNELQSLYRREREELEQLRREIRHAATQTRRKETLFKESERSASNARVRRSTTLVAAR